MRFSTNDKINSISQIGLQVSKESRRRPREAHIFVESVSLWICYLDLNEYTPMNLALLSVSYILVRNSGSCIFRFPVVFLGFLSFNSREPGNQKPENLPRRKAT
jgi:hypothetical protein